MLLFFREKNQNLLDIQEHYSQTGKNTKWAETFVRCFLSIVVYQDPLTQLLPFAKDLVGLVWGQVD